MSETTSPKVTDFGTPDTIEGLTMLTRLAELEIESVLSEFIKRLPSNVVLVDTTVFVDGRYMGDGSKEYYSPHAQLRIGLQEKPFFKPPPPPRPNPDVTMG